MSQKSSVLQPANSVSQALIPDTSIMLDGIEEPLDEITLGIEGKVQSTSTSTVPPHDHFPPLDYLEFDHVTVESLGIASDTAEALGIGYAPKGMMKGYVAVPIRLPTGELTGYIGITEGKVPKEFHLSKVVTFPKKSV